MLAQNVEENIVVSFENVKKDVLVLQNEIGRLNILLKKSNKEVSNLREYQHITNKLQKSIKTSHSAELLKINTIKRKKDVIIASKEGSKAHTKSCPFAKNIKNKIEFKTKASAFKNGFKACKCLQ